MKHKAISLLTLVIVFSVLPVYAESGYDFDQIQIAERTFHWISHYPRIWDGFQWVNYIWADDGNIIKFESAKLSYEFDKTDCSFSLNEPLTENKAINKFVKSLAIDGIDVLLSPCVIDEITEESNGLRITIKETASGSELKTIYTLNAVGVEEWTYEITNTEFLTTKTFQIKEFCLDCNPDSIKGDKIDLGSYIYDTKNEAHNKLKAIDDTTKDLLIIYETNPQGWLGTDIIDPTFTSASATTDGIVRDADNDNNCEAVPGSVTNVGAAGNVGRDASGTAIDCDRFYIEWDITSLPNSILVLDSDFAFDISAIYGTPTTCDYVGMSARPSTDTAANIWSSIESGTALFTADTQCQTTGNNKSVDLGTNGNSYITSQVSNNWAAIGIKGTGDVGIIDATDHLAEYCYLELGGCTPFGTLTVDYYISLPIEIDSIIDIENIGDIANVTGIMTVNNSTGANVTSIAFILNGTTLNTNATGQNRTQSDDDMSINFGPFYYQMLTDDVYNFTIRGTVQNITLTESQIDYELLTREYGPAYFTAEVPAQGDVNYTMINNVFKVNRDKGGATFQIECFVQNWGQTFFNSSDGTWYNETVIGAFSQDLIPDSDHYTSCYNDDLLFSATLPANYSNYLLPGLVIFDQLGGLMGAPAALVMVLAIYSLATGRNFPIISVIAMSVIGIMGALGLLIFDGAIWGLLMVLTGICVFGVRKFF